MIQEMKYGVLLLFTICAACGGEPQHAPPNDRLAQPISVHVGDMIVDIDFNGSSPTGAVPLTVYFDATRSRSTDPNNWIAAFEWDFGDGTPHSNAGWVAHTYSRAGTYTASLTVTEGRGQRATVPFIIEAHLRRSPVPIVWFSGPDQFTGSKPLRYFDATLSHGSERDSWVQAFHWDFGDGSTSTGGWVPHTYQAPGVYRATLTAIDNFGLKQMNAIDIDVPCAATTPCGQMPGKTLRARQIAGPGNEVLLRGGLGEDSGGNLIASLYYQGETIDLGFGAHGDGVFSLKAAVAKYSPTGTPLWEFKLGAVSPNGSDPAVQPYFSVVSATDQIWLTGIIRGRANLPDTSFESGNFLLSLSAGGAFQQIVRLPDVPTASAADESGNVYIAMGNVLHKYSPDATFLWTRSYGWVLRAAAFGGGKLWVGGADMLGNGRPLLARLNSDGTVFDSKALSAAVGGGVNEIAVGPSAVAITGSSSGPLLWNAAPTDDSGGNFLAVAEVTGTERWAQFPQRAGLGTPAVDGTGAIWVSGYLPGIHWAEVVSYSANGALRVARPVAWHPAAAINVSALAPHGDSMALGGQFSGQADFGAGTFSSRGADSFVLDLSR